MEGTQTDTGATLIGRKQGRGAPTGQKICWYYSFPKKTLLGDNFRSNMGRQSRFKFLFWWGRGGKEEQRETDRQMDRPPPPRLPFSPLQL